jgi:hypothetical protein
MAENDEPQEVEQLPEEEKGGILSWIIFVEITVLCLLAAYIQMSGIKQLPLP